MLTTHPTKTDALVDARLQDCASPQDILGAQGLVKSLTKRLGERAWAAELTRHLGAAPPVRPHPGSGNARNGPSAKPGQTAQGPLDVAMPRDRAGPFEPLVVPKRHRRLEGVDETVLAVYA